MLDIFNINIIPLVSNATFLDLLGNSRKAKILKYKIGHKWDKSTRTIT